MKLEVVRLVTPLPVQVDIAAACSVSLMNFTSLRRGNVSAAPAVERASAEISSTRIDIHAGCRGDTPPGTELEVLPTTDASYPAS